MSIADREISQISNSRLPTAASATLNCCAGRLQHQHQKLLSWTNATITQLFRNAKYVRSASTSTTSVDRKSSESDSSDTSSAVVGMFESDILSRINPQAVLSELGDFKRQCDNHFHIIHLIAIYSIADSLIPSGFLPPKLHTPSIHPLSPPQYPQQYPQQPNPQVLLLLEQHSNTLFDPL